MSIAFPETISGDTEVDFQCVNINPELPPANPAISPNVDLEAINGAVRTILKAVS